MAVYTQVTAEDLAAFLRNYECGTLVRFQGIAEGVENSNYKVETTTGCYILTLYEKRVESADLPFFVQLIDHIAAKGAPVPPMLRDKGGAQITSLCGKSAALIVFLEGTSLQQPNLLHAQAAAQAMGEMHHYLQDFTGFRANALGVESWPSLVEKCGATLDSIAPNLYAQLKKEAEFLHAHWPRHLEQSVIHADLFPDNILATGNDVTGIIDFTFACTDIRAYDLAIMHSAWCFDNEGRNYNPAISAALLHGYTQAHGLTAQEQAAFNLLARGACLRFTLTRAWDWLNTPADALVTRKDPCAFLRRLNHYANLG
jgi:homoserine kinase type II